MPPSSYVLLHSPVLGPSSWAPVADVLRREQPGADVRVPALATDPTGWVEAASAAVASANAATGAPAVLVTHSGGGRFVAAVRGAVEAVVFVDAALPGTATTRPEFAAFLDELTDPDTGLLPPWPQWWGSDELNRLIPDAPSVPRAVYDLPAPPDAATLRPGVRAAYLALGYEDEPARAEENGWPVERIQDATHVHLLVDPGAVAAAIVRLAAQARP